MADKVHCLNCKHCIWTVRDGKYSGCGKTREPDEVEDDPVMGMTVKKGKYVGCWKVNNSRSVGTADSAAMPILPRA